MSASVATDDRPAVGGEGTPNGAKARAAESKQRSTMSGSEKFALVASLTAICVLASCVRLFSVIKYESVIHEFDPYFNYRVTKYLSKEGFYNTWNFFDSFTWYPLGRVIGGTMYPGLIFTAGAVWNLLNWMHIPIDVQEVCVFTAPVFAAFCALATFLFMREVRGTGAGLVSAALISVVPSYISRSVAGSFDLEAVAIFALMFVFFLYVKTLNTGSLAWATGLFFGYLYMVASWGGYSFIVNLLPIHCLACIVFGRVSYKLYVAYAPFVIMGALACMNIPVIGFNAVLMSEHFASFLVFGLLHVVLLVQYTKSCLTPDAFNAAKRATLTFGTVAASAFVLVVVSYVAASPTFGWTGRSLSLLDPTYASKYIPIIASVSEHQPPNWSMYFTDLHVTALLAPAGLIMCFMPLTDTSLFLALYGVTAVYFSGVMVRLMLVLAPAVCCLSGLALSEALSYLGQSLVAAADEAEKGREATITPAVKQMKQKKEEPGISSAAGPSQGRKAGGDASGNAVKNTGLPVAKRYFVSLDVVAAGFLSISLLLAMFFRHGVYVSGSMYSSPSIVMQAGGRVIDDFREAYAWMRFNTPEDARIACWWDYGYQTTAMSNRTVLVDNNTWNNTHIATVGKAMASSEKVAWEIFESLDADYVFVVFGGLIGYPSDDINKFLWMVRIGGGEFPEIQESDYLDKNGAYRIDAGMGEGLRNSLVYKLSYYRFWDMPTARGKPGFDRVRQMVIGYQNYELEYFEEVLTTSNWMMRVYKRKKAPNVDSGMENALS